jgi:hypothetical protein
MGHNMREDKHIQFTLDGKDYDLILRVDDEGVNYVAFDIFDYAQQETKAQGVIND